MDNKVITIILCSKARLPKCIWFYIIREANLQYYFGHEVVKHENAIDIFYNICEYGGSTKLLFAVINLCAPSFVQGYYIAYCCGQMDICKFFKTTCQKHWIDPGKYATQPRFMFTLAITNNYSRLFHIVFDKFGNELNLTEGIENAFESKNYDIVKALIKKGAVIRSRFVAFYFDNVCKIGEIEIAKYLLQFFTGGTEIPFGIACRYGIAELVNLTKNQNTQVIVTHCLYVCRSGFLDTAKLLINEKKSEILFYLNATAGWNQPHIENYLKKKLKAFN